MIIKFLQKFTIYGNSPQFFDNHSRNIQVGGARKSHTLTIQCEALTTILQFDIHGNYYFDIITREKGQNILQPCRLLKRDNHVATNNLLTTMRGTIDLVIYKKTEMVYNLKKSNNK